MTDKKNSEQATPLPADIPLNCPYCGKRTKSLHSDGPTSYYECERDGLLMLPIEVGRSLVTSLGI